MKKVSFNLVTLVLIILNTGNLVQANDLNKSKQSMLFKVCRSKDANEIFYNVKTTSEGKLDLSEPIHIYWIKCDKKGKSEPLTKIQKKLAYGLRYNNITPDSAEFQFVSFPQKTLQLRKNNTGNYCVYTNVEGKEVELEQVFIQFDGGTFLMPKIAKVELRAKNHKSNDLVVEIIQP